MLIDLEFGTCKYINRPKQTKMRLIPKSFRHFLMHAESDPFRRPFLLARGQKNH